MLYTWAKPNLTSEQITTGDAPARLTEKAVEMFGVSYITASNYAKVVVWKLRRELVPQDDN